MLESIIYHRVIFKKMPSARYRFRASLTCELALTKVQVQFSSVQFSSSNTPAGGSWRTGKSLFSIVLLDFL